MKPTARIRIAPCASGKSLEVMAPTAMRPTPGQANMVSVTIEPPSRKPICRPTSVTTGIMRVAQCVTDGDVPVRGALGARRAHIVGAERFEQRRACHARHRSDEHRA